MLIIFISSSSSPMNRPPVPAVGECCGANPFGAGFGFALSAASCLISSVAVV